MNTNIMQSGLNTDQLRQLVPSAFATCAQSDVSDQYSFLPTSIVIDKMLANGWVATRAVEQRVRLEERQNFQKHMIRFCRVEDAERFSSHIRPGIHSFYDRQRPDLIRPEVVMFNSHDRSCAYRLSLGLFRLVCCNGLVVSDSAIESISVVHKGFNPDNVIEGSFRIIESAPEVLARVEDWKGYELSEGRQKALAVGAHAFRWDNPEKAPVSPEKLLAPRRDEDRGSDLWRTMNRIQENITKGGQRERGRVINHIHAPKVRAIKGLDEDTRLNKALWTMAQALREGKV